MVVPTVDLREAGRERGVAGDVDALLADLHDAAHDHVFDERGVDAVALDDRAQHVRGEVDGVLVLQLAVAAPERGAKGVDDDGVGHECLQDRWSRSELDRTVKFGAGPDRGSNRRSPATGLLH